MQKNQIIVFSFFCLFLGVAAMAMNVIPEEEVLIENANKTRISIQNQTASIVDNLLEATESKDSATIKEDSVISIEENKDGAIAKEDSVINIEKAKDGAINIKEKIFVPVQEIVYVSKEMSVKKIDDTKEEIKSVIESITDPIKDAPKILARKLISMLLSMLSPEEIKDIFLSDFNVDICK